MAKIGHGDVVTNSTKQGGLLAAYYFGAMWGCFLGGRFALASCYSYNVLTRGHTQAGWVTRLAGSRGVLVGTSFGILGAALMAGSVNSNMFICARVIAGLGIGIHQRHHPAMGQRALASARPRLQLLSGVCGQLPRNCTGQLDQFWYSQQRIVFSLAVSSGPG